MIFHAVDEKGVPHKKGSRKMDEEEIHIAVGKNFRKEKTNILWAAANFPRATIVLVHVHWPSKMMPFMGGKVLYKYADEKEKEMHRVREMEAMVKILSQYKSLCGTRKVSAHYLSHEDILAGVVNLIKKLKIKRLVIGSRNMSKQEALQECCQLWVVLNGKHISTSNGHLEHARNTGYGGSLEVLASINDLADESDGYTTLPSDLVDEIMDEKGVIQMDETNQLAMEARTVTEQNVEESIANQEEVEIFPEEPTDQSGEIQSFSNVAEEADKLREKIGRLQRKLIELERQGHNRNESSLSPKQKDASLKGKNLSKRRYPELQIPEQIAQFSKSQIGKAANDFHSRNFIGEGGYGPVYKGKIDGMSVAIKLLRPDGRQGYPEYQQEVLVLSRIEHPHIVKLIGVCSESCALVYEHLPNGTLRDRLSRGLPWKDRIRILVEQRSALVYLHSSRPHAIIHADVKLTNILLDTNNISRLGDFGTARMVHLKPLEEETICRKTNPMGTLGYMDPVFLRTGELTTESDVYAFGVIILQLLTGLLELNIVEQVEEAMKMGTIKCVLDASAGDWPVVQTECLLRLALKCCSLDRKRRPEITSSDWRTLDILQAMAVAAGKSRLF